MIDFKCPLNCEETECNMEYCERYIDYIKIRFDTLSEVKSMAKQFRKKWNDHYGFGCPEATEDAFNDFWEWISKEKGKLKNQVKENNSKSGVENMDEDCIE